MQFDDSILELLRSGEILNTKAVQIKPDQNFLTSRLSLLEKITQGKRIIHVGCCSHLHMIDRKIQEGKWLHKILTDTSSKCHGIDINKEALQYVENTLGYTNVEYCDVISDLVPPRIKSENWDIMILGEILEHTSNPVLFLESIHRKYQRNVEKLVVTVPNAFSSLNLRHLKKNVELINTDHRYWFTPYTLAKVATDAGFSVIGFDFADSKAKNISRRKKLLVYPYLKEILLKKKLIRYPLHQETLIMTLKF